MALRVSGQAGGRRTGRQGPPSGAASTARSADFAARAGAAVHMDEPWPWRGGDRRRGRILTTESGEQQTDVLQREGPRLGEAACPSPQQQQAAQRDDGKTPQVPSEKQACERRPRAQPPGHCWTRLAGSKGWWPVSQAINRTHTRWQSSRSQESLKRKESRPHTGL